MTARSQPAVTGHGDAPPPATTGIAVPPYISVEKTKTAGWRVVHVVSTGVRVPIQRRMEFAGAIKLGATASRVRECRLEVFR